MFDVIIKNGTIIDGTGESMYKADIGIRENKITKIGNLHNEKGDLEIDASYLLICPGFIDVNNHSDTYWQIFSDPDLESLVTQGITTIVGGNCGSSLAPLADAGTIASIQKWSDLKEININWLNLAEFFKVLEERKLSVNFATLVGHATLRRGLLKDEMRSPNSQELEFMERMLKNSMKDGALGMSSGLIYTHAADATTEELIELSKIVKKYDGVYVSHVRSESDNWLEAIGEAIKIATDSGAKLHISHLKVMGEKNWHLMDDALAAIGRAAENGVDITFDVFPYTNTGTVLYTLLPAWVSKGGKKMMLQRLKNPEIRAKLVEDMKTSEFDYSKIEIANSSLNKTLSRRKITDIASSQEKSVEDAVIDVLIASEGRVITSTEILSPENIGKAIVDPHSIIATNGAGYNLDHAKTGELVHPRSFGTFPRILSRYVLGKRILKWEEAIRKMSALPAEKFGIEKRGRIKEGFFADITILDRDKIEDLATAENPYQYSKGIEYVMVNGRVVLDEGNYTNLKNGEIIKKG